MVICFFANNNCESRFVFKFKHQINTVELSAVAAVAHPLRRAFRIAKNQSTNHQLVECFFDYARSWLCLRSV